MYEFINNNGYTVAELITVLKKLPNNVIINCNECDLLNCVRLVEFPECEPHIELVSLEE